MKVPDMCRIKFIKITVPLIIVPGGWSEPQIRETIL
jgi:hypothetical protein